MHPKNESGFPTPLGRIGDLSPEVISSQIPQKVFIGFNLGPKTFTLITPMFEFFRISEVANDRLMKGEPVAQRKLDIHHATKLAEYTLKGLVSAAIEYRRIHNKPQSITLENILKKLGGQPYMSIAPIVANIRECDQGGESLPGERLSTTSGETAAFKVWLSQNHVLWVIDGQHRRKGMEIVHSFLVHIRENQNYPRKGSLFPNDTKEISVEELSAWQECFEIGRTFCTITVEAHLGLNIDQERQLFHDLNRLGKKVETNLALEFDSSNPVNRYIKEVVIDDLGWEPHEKDLSTWQEDDGRLTRKDIVSICARLLLNKSNINGAKPSDVDDKSEKANKFWEMLKEIPSFGIAQSRLKTVAAQPVVLKAIAKLFFDFAFSSKKPDDAESYLRTLLEGIPKFDFSHQNPLWRYFQLKPDDRVKEGLGDLATYLPADDEGYNRDIGGYDYTAELMRFGAKHNDIYPIIGDMIRWKLRLPNRNPKS